MGFNILCMFYCEFNEKKGREIVYQIPENYIKNEEFLNISKFVIPQKEICDKATSIKLGSSYLIGYPVFLSSQNYERVNFQFNLCILVTKTEYETKYFIYDLLIEKIGKTIEKLEVEGKFEYLKNNREVIQNFMQQLFTQLTNEKNNFIDIHLDNNNVNFLFKYFDFSKINDDIKINHVPIWIKNLNFDKILYYDKNVISVIKSIDCIKNINQIAIENDLDVTFVKFIIKNLYINEIVDLIDIFQFSNIYRATYNVKDFKVKNLYKKFLCFSNLNKEIEKKFSTQELNLDNLNSESDKIKFVDDSYLFSLYIELTNSKNVFEFYDKVDLRGINIYLFIAFGVHLKIIRRIHIYAIIKYEKDDKLIDEKIIAMLDGKHCFDEICVANKTNYELLMENIKYINSANNNNNCKLIYK